jgi:hypothetical protein
MSPSHRWTHWLLALLLLCPGAQALAYSVEISQEEVQAAVATVFPIRQQIPFITTEFSNPTVRLVKGSNRIRLGLAVRASFADQAATSGQAEIEGELGYDPARGEFHLRQPAITGLDIDALPPDSVAALKILLNAATQQILPSVVLYRLDERDFRQGMMRRALKGVSVRDGRLFAELDW